MTLREVILQNLSSSSSDRRSTLSISDEGSGWSIGVTGDRRDEIGSVLWEVGLRYTGDPQNRADATLSDWSKRVTENVSGLLETLKIIEVDSIRNEAMLRSDPPTPQNDKCAYYEIMLKGTTSATVHRYLGTPDGGKRREQISYTLTNEVLAKLITDLAGTP